MRTISLRSAQLKLGNNCGVKSAFDILKMPNTCLEDVEAILTVEMAGENYETTPMFAATSLESEIKYSSYMDKARSESMKMDMKEVFGNGGGEEGEGVYNVGGMRVPETVRWDRATFNGASSEELEKLQRIRPKTIGEARMVEGITMATLTSLASHVRKVKNDENRETKRWCIQKNRGRRLREEEEEKEEVKKVKI